MITGFENLTEPLTKEEKQLAIIIVKGLKTKIGKRNAISSSKIIEAMSKYSSIPLNGARLRKIINYIRKNYIPRLCATSDGYYVANTKEELKEYRDSLKERIDAITEIFNIIDAEYRNFQTLGF